MTSHVSGDISCKVQAHAATLSHLGLVGRHCNVAHVLNLLESAQHLLTRLSQLCVNDSPVLACNKHVT